jgi:hypothetical protein
MALKSASDTGIDVYDTTGAGICMDSTSMYYLIDSNARYWGLDSLDGWLQTMGGIWSAYDRMGYYNWKGDVSVADSIYTSIGGMLPASSPTPDSRPDIVDYAKHGTLWTIVKGAENASRNIYTLDSAEIAGLDTSGMPQFTYSTGRMMMYSLLSSYTGGWGTIHYPCVTTGGGLIGTRIGNTASSENKNEQYGPIVPNGTKQFVAYPNPANSLITFAYNLPESKRITIIVTNVLGEKVMETTAMLDSSTSGKASWNATSVAPGIYLYEAMDEHSVISRGKIVVVK